MEMPLYVPDSTKFIPGVTPVLYSGPYWDSKEIEAATKALLTGKWLVAGEYVARFQNEFSRKFNVKFSHMVNSGSSANLTMIAALKKRLGWKDGDEIIVSPVGFPTTIAPLVQSGLKPVFVDIEMSTLNFDLKLVSRAITNKTQAILVSPVLGNVPDMDELSRMDVSLVGDNCDSLGSLWSNKLWTDQCYSHSCSFYPAHHISTGEGGMVSSNDEELISMVRSFSLWGRACYCVGSANLLPCGTCGKRFSDWLNEGQAIDHKYVFDNIGYNLTPLDLQGAIGLEQLKKFDDIKSKRHHNFIEISKLFSGSYHVRTAKHVEKASPSWFGVPLICRNRAIKENLVAYLEANKIQTRPYFAGNILRHPGYRYLGDANKFPLANEVMDKVFFIGCAPYYDEKILAYIAEVVEAWKA